MIDKNNPLWNWSKPSKEFKKQYKEMYGLEATEVGFATDKYFDLLEKLLVKDKKL